MASMDFNATQIPQNMTSALGLIVDQQYTGQNVSTVATLYAREDSVQPAVGARAFRHESGGFFYFMPSANNDLWVWTDDPDGCPVIVTEG